jgi:drug/metabolite transporter (DMT)-like permease
MSEAAPVAPPCMPLAAALAAPHRARGIGLMVLSTLSFTANVLLIRELGKFMSVSVAVLASVRFLVGMALLAAFYWTSFQPSHLFRNRKLAERGLVGAGGVYVAYIAVVHLGAGRATFINNTYIFWAALMAAWIFHERLRAVTVAGIIAALAGLALLTDVFAPGSKTNVYDLFAVLSALGSAIVAITIRQLHATEHTATIFGAQCVYGLLACGPFAAPHVISLPALSWGLLIVAGVCAATGQLAMTRAYRDLTVAEGSLMQMLAPISTALGGALFFGEQLTLRELAGASLILVGTASVAVRRTTA